MILIFLVHITKWFLICYVILMYKGHIDNGDG